MSNRFKLLASIAVLSCALAGCASSTKTATAPTSSAAASASSTAAATVTFDGVTVTGANDLSAKPKVTASSKATPAALAVKDLIVGTGAPAAPTASVTVQYVGVLLADGKQFDASWDNGGVTTFSLQQVVAGFTQGIGGTAKVAPMKVGGRRLMILPSALGYGSTGTPDGSIPADAPIVFVVDLVAVK